MSPHVGIEVPLGFKHLPTYFAFGVWGPIIVFICNIQLVLSLILIIVFATAVVSAETLGFL